MSINPDEFPGAQSQPQGQPQQPPSPLFEHMQPQQPLPPQQPPSGRKPKKGLIWLLSIVLVLLLGGAGVGTVLLLRSLSADSTATSQTENDNDSTAADSSSDNKSSDTPTGNDAPSTKPATPATGPLKLPNCAALSPAGQQAMEDLKATGFDISVAQGEVGPDVFAQNFGPVAQATLAKASQSRGCFYVTSPETGYVLFVAEIDPSKAQPLVAAVQADSRFAAGTIGPASTYISTAVDETTIGPMYSAVAHAFYKDVWVSLAGSLDGAEAQKLLTEALEAVYQANPGVG